MHRLVFVLIVFCFISNSAFAFKVYHYNEKGERVYRTITQEDIRKNKAAPKRSFVRLPKNWEITDEMRARNKKTIADYTHRK